MIGALRQGLVLALYPNVSGLCYAAFEARLAMIDWGIKTARQAKEGTLERHAQSLINAFGPATIVLPGRRALTRGSGRIQMIVGNIDRAAKESGAVVYSFTRAEMQSHFGGYGARSKDAIARVIVGVLPEYRQHLPPPRKIWMSEDYRMGLFDAAALGIMYFETQAAIE